MTRQTRRDDASRGKLRIGDDWNAISIIALSQSNPLKAVAEFVENSIDAHARNIRIVRGKERGESFLVVADDGDGVPKDPDGRPDFRYVATHLCDSVKRRLKAQGVAGLQGEFGIGLMSFWTLGEALYMTCTGADERTYQMRLARNDPSYTVTARRALAPTPGTELKVKPLLPGIRQLSGERLSWYLASELRDRIRASGVDIRIVDHQSRKTFAVVPREFDGRLLHEIQTPATRLGDVYLELYLDETRPGRRVGLHRHGTRVLENIAELPGFDEPPWTEGVIEGIVDAPFLSLTPGTRTGVIQDAAYAVFVDAMAPVAAALTAIIDAQRRAEEDRASEQLLKSIQRAFREALLTLPTEEYDWFDVRRSHEHGSPAQGQVDGIELPHDGRVHAEDDERRPETQRDFFDFPGPLDHVRISPASCVLPVGQTRTFRAVCRDRSRRAVEHDLSFAWRVVAGGLALSGSDGELVTVTAPAEPGLAQLAVDVRQGEIVRTAEALVTVTDQLIEAPRRSAAVRGLPGYTYEHAPGALWRSRHDATRALIVINSGHRDFVFASRSKSLKLRYLGRLFVKELIQLNFPGASPAEALERMIELSLYVEEHLR
jgi:hypothetical protein